MRTDDLVWCGNDLHPDCYKTLVLLKLYDREKVPVYFVVEGVCHLVDRPGEDHFDAERYYYDDHSCPTNYVPVEAVFTPCEDDPHGVFDYVRTAWYPAAYDEAKASGNGEEFLRSLFPETRLG